MNPPQAVSSRYVRNLICEGKNSSFEIEKIEQKIATTPGGIPVGFYYHASVKRSIDFEAQDREGATPEQAVQACLSAHGVTFR